MKNIGLSKLEQNLRRDEVELLDSEFVLYRGRWLILLTIVLVRSLCNKKPINFITSDNLTLLLTIVLIRSDFKLIL